MAVYALLRKGIKVNRVYWEKVLTILGSNIVLILFLISVTLGIMNKEK